MLNFLRKDLLLQIRDYPELALLLLMPIILTGILGMALGNVLTDSGVTLKARAAIVNEDNAVTGREEFQAQLAVLPLPQRLALGMAARTIEPLEILQSLLASPEMTGFLTVAEMSADEAGMRIASDEVQAVITVPADFTRDVLSGMLLGETGGSIEMQMSSASPLRASVIHDILTGFAREISFQSALSQQLQGPAVPAPVVDGGMESIAVAAGVSSVAYYTLAMAVMFALFVAGSTSSRAFLEKDSLTYDRILISGASPRSYLLGKVISASIVVSLQMMFLFLAGTLMLGAFRGESASFWAMVLLGIVLLGLNVGALAALITAINFRLGNRSLSDVFSSVLVMVLAVFGGSFFPIDQLAPVFGWIGQWTPNGAALTSLLGAVKGLSLADIAGDYMRLLIMATIFLGFAFWLFHRRGEA